VGTGALQSGGRHAKRFNTGYFISESLVEKTRNAHEIIDLFGAMIYF
jgi:hypothetical protein